MVWWRCFLQVLCCIPFTSGALSQNHVTANIAAFQLRSLFSPHSAYFIVYKKYGKASALFLFTPGAAIFGSQEVVRNFQLSNKETEAETSNVELGNSDFWVQMERNIRAHPSTQGALVDVDLIVASDNGPVSTSTFPPHNIGSTRVNSTGYGTAVLVFHYTGVPLPHRWVSIQVEWVVEHSATRPPVWNQLHVHLWKSPSLPLRRGLEHSSLRKFIGSNSIAMVITIATQALIVRTGWFKTSGGWRTNTEE